MPSIVPHVLMDSRSGENQAPLDAMASEGCGSTVSTSTVATCWPASEEENEEKSTAEVECETGGMVNLDFSLCLTFKNMENRVLQKLQQEAEKEGKHFVQPYRDFLHLLHKS